jgi:hypothetical protein
LLASQVIVAQGFMHVPALQVSPAAQTTPTQLSPHAPFTHFFPAPQSTP